MKTVFRVSLLRTLAPRAFNIPAELGSIESELRRLEEMRQLEVLALAYMVSVLVGLGSTTLIFYMFGNLLGSLVFSAPLMLVFCLTKYGAAFLRDIVGLLIYSEQSDDIAELRIKIFQIIDSAKKYQRHLEPENAPGLVAIFSDVIVDRKFVCDLSLYARNDLIQLSKMGRGSEIPLRHYGILFKSLRLFNSELLSTDTITPGLDNVRAQSVAHVAIAYGYQLAGKVLNSEGNTVLAEHYYLIAKYCCANAVNSGFFTGLSPRVRAAFDQVRMLLDIFETHAPCFSIAGRLVNLVESHTYLVDKDLLESVA